MMPESRYENPVRQDIGHRKRFCGFGCPQSRARALTLIEIIISLAIMVIIIAVIVPQFVAMRNSWDSKQGAAETLQSGRILIDHLNRNLSKAVKITDVSGSDEPNGFIQFEDNDGNNLRYDINSTSNYAEFGYLGDLSDLAGPVSQLQFSCYDACDLDTPLDISTADVNDIRFVQAETTLTNSSTLGQDETLIASAYLRTNDDEISECGLVGWWKLDETSGLTAVDSSGQGNDGTLTNMVGDEWTDGAVGGALEFDGFNDYVQTTSNESKTSTDFTWACWFKTDTTIGAHHLVWQGKATENGWGAGASGYHEAHINVGAYDTDNILGCFYGTNEDATAPGVIRIDTSFSDTTNWHHVAFVVTDADSSPSGELFLDGVSVGTDTGNQTGRTDWDTNLRIARPGANERYFDGTIDDVRVYNRALDVNEISELASPGVTYEEFTEAKADSDTTSITISTPGGSTVAILGSWTTGLTHTAESGTNRALIFIAHEESISGSPTLTSVTYGEQTMTKVIERSAVATYGNYVAGFILDEAGVAAATSGDFDPTWSGTTSSVSYASVFLSNVNQTTLTGASASNGTTGTTPNPITTSALATNSGDMVIVGATCGNNGSYTLHNGFTEGTDQSVGVNGHTGVAGHKSATGVDETPSAEHTSVNRQVIIGFVAQVGDSDIEGDLLIAAVATDGSETISPPGGEGWTEIDIDDYSNAVTLGAWWKLADASESSSHEFTWSGDEQAYGWMMQFTGHDPTDPINDWSASGESSSTPTSPAVTTTVDNCLILRLGAFDDDDITVDDPGLSSHTAITMDKSNSDGGSTVAILGSWTTGLTHTAESGTNRALIFIAHEESISGSPTLTSVTYGEQTMTKVIERSAVATYGNYVAAFILDEAGVAAATNDTFTPTWSSATSSVSYASVFLSNVNQTTLTGASASNGTTGITPNPITTSALATNSGDMVIVGATCGNNGSYTLHNGFTEGTDQSVGTNGHTGVAGHKSATGVDETPSAEHTSVNRQVIIGFVVQGVTGGSDTVSGGAGYVSQSASGDSGTSDFSLTASEQAQMLTIAIAPVSSDSGCESQIRP